MDIKEIYALTRENFNDICKMYLFLSRTFTRCKLIQQPSSTKRRGKAFQCKVGIMEG